MSSQGVMSSKKTNTSPGLCPIKGQLSGPCSQIRSRPWLSLRSHCKYCPLSSTGPGNQATTFLCVGKVPWHTILNLEPSTAVGVGTLLPSQSLVPSSWHTTTAAPFVQYVSMSLGVNPSSGSSSTSPQIVRWVLKKFSLET